MDKAVNGWEGAFRSVGTLENLGTQRRRVDQGLNRYARDDRRNDVPSSVA
jgi:hypothetical protein